MDSIEPQARTGSLERVGIVLKKLEDAQATESKKLAAECPLLSRGFFPKQTNPIRSGSSLQSGAVV
jgi:hypothetical protein